MPFPAYSLDYFFYLAGVGGYGFRLNLSEMLPVRNFVEVAYNIIADNLFYLNGVS